MPFDPVQKISDSELEIMRVLWQAPDALPVSDIRRQLKARKGWEDTTIKTLVQRLVKKGAILQESRQVYYYRPAVSEKEYCRWATEELIHKVYRGSARDLVAALISADTLSQEDVAELRSMFRSGRQP